MKRAKKITRQQKISQRAAPAAPELNYRTLSLRVADDGRPATLDEETRSVEVVGASEERVRVFDYQRFEIVDEVLLMSGGQMPKSRQVVMLDNHQRYNTGSVIGSYRQMHIANDQLLGRAHYSTVPEAEGPYTKMREGHLTDYSAGYQILKSVWVPAGETKTIKGREFVGPVSVVTRWKIKELSNCPIGADEVAKTRGDDSLAPENIVQNSNRQQAAKENVIMNKRLKSLLESRGLPADATEAQAWRFFHDLDEEARAEVTNELSAEPQPAPAANKGDDGARSATVTAIPGSAEAVVDQIAVERNRVSEIRALGRKYDCLDALEDFIDDGSPIDQARSKALDIVSQKRDQEDPPGAGFSPARVVKDQRDKFRAAAQDALMVRGDMAIETPAPGHDELTGFSLVEVAREALRMANQPTRGHSLEMVGRALTTSDFPLLLANVANKSLFAGFDRVA